MTRPARVAAGLAARLAGLYRGVAGEDGRVESLAGLLEQRAFWCRLVPEDAQMSEQTRREREEHFGVRMGIDLASDHTMLGRSEENNWGQDRAAMRDGGSFSGLPGVSVEDVAVQEAQGPIADRSRENLGAQDIAIVTMRRLLLAGARRVAAGQPPLSDPKAIDYAPIRPAMAMLPASERWQDMDRAGAPSAARPAARSHRATRPPHGGLPPHAAAIPRSAKPSGISSLLPETVRDDPPSWSASPHLPSPASPCRRATPFSLLGSGAAGWPVAQLVRVNSVEPVPVAAKALSVLPEQVYWSVVKAVAGADRFLMPFSYRVCVPDP